MTQVGGQGDRLAVDTVWRRLSPVNSDPAPHKPRRLLHPRWRCRMYANGLWDAMPYAPDKLTFSWNYKWRLKAREESSPLNHPDTLGGWGGRQDSCWVTARAGEDGAHEPTRPVGRDVTVEHQACRTPRGGLVL